MSEGREDKKPADEPKFRESKCRDEAKAAENPHSKEAPNKRVRKISSRQHSEKKAGFLKIRAAEPEADVRRTEKPRPHRPRKS